MIDKDELNKLIDGIIDLSNVKPRYELRTRRELLGEDGEDEAEVSSHDRDYIFYKLGEYLSDYFEHVSYYAVYDNVDKRYVVRIGVLK